MSTNFAVIDLGSNSIRMSVNTVEKGGTWRVLKKLRETVRLSEGMTGDNFLKEEAMSRVISAVKFFCEVAKEYKCVSVAAVATAALRNAANKKLFLSRVKAEAGLDFQIISGEEEAYFSYLAVRETVGITDGVIYDTGGGSTEITLVKNGEVVHSTSLPLGAVILTEKFLKSTQMQMYKYAASYIGAISWLDECEGLPLYGIGGSARAMALLHKKGESPEDGIRIPYHNVAKIYQNIFNTPREKRSDISGMEKERADIILAGLAPVKILMDMTGSPEVRVCASGVKEGVFFRMKNEVVSNEF